MAKPTTFYLL